MFLSHSTLNIPLSLAASSAAFFLVIAMATILYKDGKPHRIEAVLVPQYLSEGYTVEKEPIKKKGRRSKKEEVINAAEAEE